MAFLGTGTVIIVERLQRDSADVDVPRLVSAAACHAGAAATHHGG